MIWYKFYTKSLFQTILTENVTNIEIKVSIEYAKESLDLVKCVLIN